MNVSSGAAKVFKYAFFFLFSCQTNSKFVNKYLFIVAGLSTSQLPLVSLRGGPLT